MDFLQAQLKASRAAVTHYLRHKKVLIDGKLCGDPLRKVRPGQEVTVDLPESSPRNRRTKKQVAAPTTTSPLLAEILIRHVDPYVIVVEKPAGLTTVRHAHEAKEFGTRAKKFLPSTLVDLMPALLQRNGMDTKGRVRAVHRLDRDTSGLIVLARTPDAEAELGKQFRRHATSRTYLALVRGQAKDARIESFFVEDRGDHRRGSNPAGEGQRAITNVKVLEELIGFTLVECRLETGRTHQVRIHLGEQGTPLCGERIYDRPLHGKPIPDTSGAERLFLHAIHLQFDHPKTGERMEFESRLPHDMFAILQKLRKKPSSGKPKRKPRP